MEKNLILRNCNKICGECGIKDIMCTECSKLTIGDGIGEELEITCLKIDILNSKISLKLNNIQDLIKLNLLMEDFKFLLKINDGIEYMVYIKSDKNVYTAHNMELVEIEFDSIKSI